MQFNRRDIGYSIISRFESYLRDHISFSLIDHSDDFSKFIPNGVLAKAVIKNSDMQFESIDDLLEQTDFPDLTEICCFNNSFSFFFPDSTKEGFQREMSILYGLRCKIAHVKGFFTSIDLDKLIELSCFVLKKTKDFKKFQQLLKNLERTPAKFIVSVPLDFTIDYLENNGILNNLPIPDYEYEGGFVGREDDIKKITSYLESDKFAVVTITGAGGVGKTSLSLKVVQELTQNPDFKKFDAIIWLSAKENKLTHLGIEDIEPTIKSYEELLDTIISVLEFEVENSILKKEEMVNTIFEMSKGILIIVDNLETITDERVINFIIDSPKTAKFLITSRKGLGQVERRHELKQLKEKEAIYLFRQTARDKQLNTLSILDDQIIKKYVVKVSCFPLAIKWVLGLVARGKDINRVIASINDATGDISKFCFSEIFSDLSQNCKLILYAICCFDSSPIDGVLRYVVAIDQNDFEDGIEELIIVSLIIPEQFRNEQDEIAVKYSIIPLTKGYIRSQLNKNITLKQKLEAKIAATQSTIADTEKAKREYRYSLNNLGAVTDAEKVAAILVQTALQKYEANLYEDAVENYKSAISLAPRFSTIYRNWAVMESMEGNWNEADVLIGKAKDLNPHDPQIWLVWGNIHKRASKFTEAHEKYEKALKLAPTDHIILNAYGNMKNRLGQFEIADHLFNEALEIGIGLRSIKHEIINRSCLAENLLNWGENLYKDRNFPLSKEKLDIALQQCLRILSIDNKDPKSIALLAQCYFKLGIYNKRVGRNEDAISYFEKLVNVNTVSNREDYYIVNGTLEYVSLKINEGKYSLLENTLLPLKDKFPTVFQKTTFVLEKWKSLCTELHQRIELNPNHQEDEAPTLNEGKIIKIDFKRNFVIIQGKETTFLAIGKSFTPPIKLVSKSLLNKSVKFKIHERAGKNYANNVFLDSELTV